MPRFALPASVDETARDLMLGSRRDRGVIHHADHDLITTRDGPHRTCRRRDCHLIKEL